MKALLIVDVQNDFCPGGALAVPGGGNIVPVLNRYIAYFSRKKLPVFASRDWHPPRTQHFVSFGGKWPAHCIQGTRGALFHPALKLPRDAIQLYKGMYPDRDDYSALQAEDLGGRNLASFAQMMGIKELYVGGLATDYCVKESVLDALKKGLKVKLLTDGIKGVDLKPGDSEKAIARMVKAGARKITVKVLSK